jgi:dephospho-CoA kinase
MHVIGVTGGVATGKSLLTEAFRKQGATVISADAISHEVASPGSTELRRIAEEFGERFVTKDGSLDRKALGDLVFGNPEARKKLEAILHPAILKRIRDAIERLRNLPDPPEVVIVEVPLLYEVGMEDWFDKVLVVAATTEDQVLRLQARDGLTAEAARLRIEAQMPLESKVARADYVIWNTGRPEDLQMAAAGIMKSLSEGGILRETACNLTR